MEAKRYRTWGVFALVVTLFTFAFLPMTASAAAGVNQQLNFTGKVVLSNGTNITNGTYNMQFKIYQDGTNTGSGSTLKWTENRLISASNGVAINGGVFTVNLGSVTAFGSSVDWNQDTLWLSLQVGNTSSCTISTSFQANCGGDGEMSPYIRLTAVPQAMNAQTVGGLTATEFARVSVANTYTAAQTVNVSSATALDVKTGATSLLVADTASTVVKIGNPGTATLGSVRLLTTNAEFSGTIRIGDATNGIDFTNTGVALRGNARATRTVTLAPEYAGATFTGDGTNNTGSLSSDFCSNSSLLNINPTACNNATNEFNYYAWTTTQASAQDYDIYVRYRMPSDYDTGSMTDMKLWAWGTTGATEIASLALHKASATPCSSIADAVTSNITWAESTVASPLGSCTINAGDYVTFKLKLTAGQNNTVRVGAINFSYRSKF